VNYSRRAVGRGLYFIRNRELPTTDSELKPITAPEKERREVYILPPACKCVFDRDPPQVRTRQEEPSPLDLSPFVTNSENRVQTYRQFTVATHRLEMKVCLDSLSEKSL